jgi:hypothetical protein
MGTRSNIAVKNDDGTVTVIYCHWDGYPSNNGVILHTHYRTAEQVQALLALGDLGSLRAEIGHKHDFNYPNPKWCVSYGRDRHADNVNASTYASVYDWMSLGGEEYNYLFIDGVWYVNDHGELESSGFAVFTDLATVLVLDTICQ